MADSPRLKPLPWDLNPDLKDGFEQTRKRLGFLPNSQLILQRRPALQKAFRAFSQAVSGPDSSVDAKMRALITFACCTVSREPYVWSHAAHSLLHTDQEAKLTAFKDFRTSPAFTPKERVTIEYAQAAARVPNGVTDGLVARLREHWTEEEIVDITALIGLYGFFDRYNGSMATPLEDEPREVGEKYLKAQGWSPGSHG